MEPPPMPDPAAPADEGPTTLSLLQQFRRCAHLMRHSSSHGGGTRILVKLLLNGPVTQRALADLLERTPATLSQQLEPLERAGLVERAPLESDRRTLVVRLTESGVAAAQEARVRNQRVADELFGSLDDADRRDLARIVGILEASWRARPTAPETQGSR